jgi:hypothetical protein
MHLTLKKEATRPAGANLLQQQAKFDAFLEEFNNERPHEALQMKYPGGGLFSFLPPLPGHSGTQLPVPRQDDPRHQLRPPFSIPQKDQSQHLSGRPGRRHQRSRRRHSVTHVSGPDIDALVKHTPPDRSSLPLYLAHRFLRAQ